MYHESLMIQAEPMPLSPLSKPKAIPTEIHQRAPIASDYQILQRRMRRQTQRQMKQHEKKKKYLYMKLPISDVCNIVLEYIGCFTGKIINKIEHPWFVSSLVALNDDKIAILSDVKIRVWDVPRCECIMTLDGCRVVQLPNGKIITADVYNMVSVWDVSTGACIKQFHTTGFDYGVSLTAMSNDTIVLGYSSGLIRVWNITSELCTLELDNNGINAIVALDDTKIAYASHDYSVQLWDLLISKCYLAFTKHTDIVYKLVMSNGDLVSGSEDGTVRFWNVFSGECMITITHTDAVRSFTILDDGQIAICTPWDGIIYIYNKLNKCTMMLQTESVRNMHFIKCGVLATSHWDNSIRLWE
jgi:WD40 repeat protein